jgi:hypothetical protein
MKMIFLALALFSTAYAGPVIKGEFPRGPESSVTPGSFCDRPDAYRYSEKVPYCNRDVDTALKADVFREYRNLGWNLNPKDRPLYKIDHLIPLCMGGSNREDNLWPQHKTVYEQTDMIEAVGCEKLKAGVIKQAEVVSLLLAAKLDLSLTKKTLEYLQKL